MARFIRTLLFVLSIASIAIAADSWSLSDATLAVAPKGKEATSSYKYITFCNFKLINPCSFGASSQVEDTLELSSTDTLRLTYTTTEGGKAARPHQSFILVEDSSANLDIAIPVQVKASGKANLDIVCVDHGLSYRRNIVIYLLGYYMQIPSSCH